MSERGLKSVSGDTFSLIGALGGVRGVVESMAPGAVFVAVFVIVNAVAPTPPEAGLSRAFWWALGASTLIVLVAFAVRLAQRTPVTQALGGLVGTAIGAVWAWRADADAAFFAWGLWLNAGYLVGYLISILVRWPVIGILVELARAGFTAESVPTEKPFAGFTAWRRNPDLLKRYSLASWIWVAMFASRLAVQVPLFRGDAVGWLATARLVMGVPLWGLVLWLTWAVVRATPQEQPCQSQRP